MTVSCRVSVIYAFCRLTTQTPLHNQLPSRYRSHKAQPDAYQTASPNWLPWQHPSAPLDPIKHDSLGPSEPTTPTIGSAVLHRWPQGPYTLQWDAPFPLKIAPSMGDLDSHLIHGSLGPAEFSTQIAPRLVQPFLQGLLLWQTDRQTTPLSR